MQIEVKNLSFTYMPGTLMECRALSDVSFSLDTGSFLGITGKTGCGKSTLLQLIAGLLEPTEGGIIVGGEDINGPGYDRRKLRRSLSIVFQFPEYQLFETTVERDVSFSLRQMGMEKNEIAKRVEWALETMGFRFDEIRGKSPLALSSGQKRRVAIAGALVSRPEILMFDEPFAGLDPFSREDFIRLVRTLNASGTTIVIVSHDSDSLLRCAGEVMVLEDGRIGAYGPAVEVLSEKHAGVGRPAVIELADMIGLEKPVSGYDELLDAIAGGLA